MVNSLTSAQIAGGANALKWGNKASWSVFPQGDIFCHEVWNIARDRYEKMTDHGFLCDNYRPGWFLVYPAGAAGIPGSLIRVSGKLVSPGISKKYNGS